jgi:uncharacterized lipoprotein YmbA
MTIPHGAAPRFPLRRIARAWPVLAAFALGACASSAPLHYYTLETVPSTTRPVDAAPTSAVRAGLPIELRSVQIPPALDRLEMMRSVAPGELALRESDHWAAPLGRMSRQTLADDLAERLPSGGLLATGAATSIPRAALSVEVVAFEISGGTATMRVRWAVLVPAEESPAEKLGTEKSGPVPLPRSRSARLSMPADDSASALQHAWSALIAQAADRIVEGLAAP